MSSERTKRSYSHTINLPKTDFPMRARLPEREPELLERWRREGIYGVLQARRAAAPRFVLHDGPPYSNGHIHLGTAVNKTVKDFVVRSRGMMGLAAPFVPGWDNHGMPIEINVSREHGEGAMDVLTLRRRCREYAQKFVDLQREEFQRLGCLGDWERAYLTMSSEYEAGVLRVFGELVERGYIYRGLRPIHWCPGCKTALAEAEIEYATKTSSSVTVSLPLCEDPHGLFPHPERGGALVWTTTPWTIPANRAVVANPEFRYAVVEAEEGEFLLAEDLVEAVMEVAGIKEYHVVATRPGRDLTGLVFLHPLEADRSSPLLLGEHVSLEEGTGLVHTAPGHGEEDFLVGKKYELEIFCPVDEAGRFTAAVKRYAGLSVDEANPKIIEDLRGEGRLLAGAEIQHQYPHCWRCKSPLLFRTTRQWFLAVDHENLRQRALEEIAAVRWLPPAMRNRIAGMVEQRPDWCLSRQRAWGVGIPAFYCEACGEVLLNRETVNHVADLVGEHGSDCWFEWPVEQLLPEGATCEGCGESGFRKETDILDVWFDSGASQRIVLEGREDLHWPADIYVEGTDQHRGWFNSSLILSVATKGRAPYREVLTLGWVLDAEGRTMHKSLGNVVSPLDLIAERGADVLRLWAAATDMRRDIRFSRDHLDQVSETYRRLRNTFRFLLSNTADFHGKLDSVPYEELMELDRFALHGWEGVKEEILHAYKEYLFHQVYHVLQHYVTVNLSAFYLDVLKDRLYVEAPDSRPRRSAQTVLAMILEELVRLLAPILPFTAEEVWTHLDGEESVHLQTFPALDPSHRDPGLAEAWSQLLAVRGEVSRAVEAARNHKLIGGSLEAEVVLVPGHEDLRRALERRLNGLPELLIVSKVVLRAGADGADVELSEPADLPLRVGVHRAPGEKCERCWHYDQSVGAESEYPDLCERCLRILEQRGLR